MIEEITPEAVWYTQKINRHEQCGGVFILQPGRVLLSYPAKYPHKCNRCGLERNLAERYPRTFRHIKTGMFDDEQIKEV